MKRMRESTLPEVVHLPPEIISKILTFLPVKSLLKFRCVSKWWNSLIGSPDFTKEHLECSGETRLNKKLILCRGTFIYSAAVDQEASHIDIDAEVLDIPIFESCFQHPQILGSCRGLLCLGSEDCCLLWNPFTRTHHILPDARHVCQEKGCLYQLVHGLGYDELHDDYKVVRVVQFLGISYQMHGVEDYDNVVIVFSLKSNSWKRLSDFPHFVHGERAVFVNGALHYIVSRKKGNTLKQKDKGTDCLIASFDVADETYQLVPQPDYPNQHFALGIGELGGYLCMIRHYNLVRLYQIWVMKEYGVGESWTELFRIGRGDGPMHCLTPITYLESVTEVLIKRKERIYCLDLKRRSSKRVEIYGTDHDDDDELSLDEFSDVCVCTESLVLLDSSDGDNDGNVDYDYIGYDDSNEMERAQEQNQDRNSA